MHLVRKELGLTFEDMRKLSLPRALSIFETYLRTVDPDAKNIKTTKRKEVTPDDLEKDW